MVSIQLEVMEFRSIWGAESCIIRDDDVRDEDEPTAMKFGQSQIMAGTLPAPGKVRCSRSY